MSNYDEYVANLDSANLMRQSIERLQKLLRETEVEYYAWTHSRGLHEHLKGLSSKEIERMFFRAVSKHSMRKNKEKDSKK